jgi:hypothetical protein
MRTIYLVWANSFIPTGDFPIEGAFADRAHAQTMAAQLREHAIDGDDFVVVPFLLKE